MGKSSKNSASKADAAPAKPSNKDAEDIIRNDNRKKRKKRKRSKKALVEENDGGVKTRKTFMKEKDGDCRDEQELKEGSCVVNTDKVKVSAEINPIDLNVRLGDENNGVKKDASAPKEPPATDNGHRDESENDHPKEEFDDGEPKTKKFKVSPSGTIIRAESNSKASKEDGCLKVESSEEEPSKMQQVVEPVTVPVEDNSSEEISSEEDMAVSSDEEEASAAPVIPSNKAEDVIRNDNRKKRKKRKKALVEENDGGAKTNKMLMKEKDDDHRDEQELHFQEGSCVVNTDQVKVSAEINPIDSNPRLRDENSGVKKDASAPKETPATDNGHSRDKSENDHPKEEFDVGEPKAKKFKVSPSGALIQAESNSKASKEDGCLKEERSEEPSKMQQVVESVTVPVEDNSSEEIYSEEDMAVSSDEEEAGAAPVKPSNKAEEVIRNDNRKKRKKRKKALVEENGGGAKTNKMLMKEKDDDHRDEQELQEGSCVVNTGQVKVSAEINPIDSNPRLRDENSGVKKDASAPKETPATDNGHSRDKSENDHPKEEFDVGEPKAKKFKVSPSGALIQAESNFKASKEDGCLKEERSEEPSKMQQVVESVTVPVEDNSSEEIYSEEDMAVSSDEEEAGAAPVKPSNKAEEVIRNDNRKKLKKRKKALVEENGGGAKTNKMLMKEKDDDHRDEQELQALEKLNGKALVGSPVRLQLAKEEKVQSFRKDGRAQRQTIFVCGFNKDDGEDQVRSALQDHFGSCGEITRVSIPRNNEGGVRGIAYIDFKDYNAYNQALAFDRSVFRKNTLTVEAANPRDNGFDGGSRGGWRGGQGSGGRISGHQRGGRTGQGDFTGGGLGGPGHGRAAPGGS
ncbi:uncharacterized protein [Henckelia pumila]|uniref:uncharacterized protein isoform X3 n=1 Tax=Henckelia pumila TaxID=405737 RepID=UPI003C6E037A